jgi:septum formation protein
VTFGEPWYRKGIDSMSETGSASDTDLVLGSASPRRHDLLSSVGIRFRAVTSQVEETLLNGEEPSEHVSRLALAKAREVSGRVPGAWVLGADTIVVIDGMILGKPADVDEAKRMLTMLQSRTHLVFTGYAIVNSRYPEKTRVRFVRSEVHIRELNEAEIEGYIRTGEPMDKAGAYAIQGIGSGIVQEISGSYTNVVGLPLCEVIRDLKELGIVDVLEGRGGP